MHIIIVGNWTKVVITAAKGETPQKVTMTVSVPLPSYRDALSRLVAGIQYEMLGASMLNAGAKAVAKAEVRHATKKTSEAELTIITTEVMFIDEMTTGQINSLLDSSSHVIEQSKTFIPRHDVETEWTLEFDDGQPDLFEKEYQRIIKEEDAAIVAKMTQIIQDSQEADPDFEKLVETLKAKYGEDCDLAEVYKQYVAEQKGEPDEDTTEA